jgi:hypothetical protein
MRLINAPGGGVLVKTGLSIFDYLNSEVRKGPHPALALGWRDDQLDSVVALLDPLLPNCLPNKPEKVITQDMERAVHGGYIPPWGIPWGMGNPPKPVSHRWRVAERESCESTYRECCE